MINKYNVIAYCDRQNCRQNLTAGEAPLGLAIVFLKLNPKLVFILIGLLLSIHKRPNKLRIQ